MSNSRLLIVVAVIVLALVQLACATPSGVDTVDDAADELVENQKEEKFCNLSILGIGGIINPVKRLDALENCTPNSDEQEKYDSMIEKAQEEIRELEEEDS